MKVDGLDLRSALDGEKAQKRPYQTPQVRSLGTVRDLTLTGGTVQQTDVITHVIGKTNT